MALMFIRLEGRQSWGVSDLWSSRSTETTPTKSGVVGLLSAALGYTRGDKRIDELSKAVKISVRINRPGIIETDFQTIKADTTANVKDSEALIYYKRYRRDKNGVPVVYNASGSIDTYATKTRNKAYINDASFTVFIEGDEALLISLSEALKHPVFQVYLGRKSCIPSLPVIGTVVSGDINIEDAWKTCDITSDMCGRSYIVEYEPNGGEPARSLQTRMDDPHGNNKYSARCITRKEITCNVSE